MKTKNGRRLGIASNNFRRSALFHLYRKYRASQDKNVTEELTILFIVPKSKIAIE